MHWILQDSRRPYTIATNLEVQIAGISRLEALCNILATGAFISLDPGETITSCTVCLAISKPLSAIIILMQIEVTVDITDLGLFTGKFYEAFERPLKFESSTVASDPSVFQMISIRKPADENTFRSAETQR